MKNVMKKTLATGFTLAVLGTGTVATAAPAQAGVICDDGVYSNGVGYAICDDGKSDSAVARGLFSLKYKCAGQDRWYETEKKHATGDNIIRAECAPHSGVTHTKTWAEEASF